MRLSISKIKLFKACRKAYYFKYVEGLEPVQKPESLETGSNYHKLIEGLYNDGCLPECDYSKEHAMAKAYEKYIYPKFKVAKAEKWLERVIGTDLYVGVADGISEDGCIVEHKTTSMEVGPEYEYQLHWDEQILAYMWLTGMRKVYYTVCRKPTIRLKKDESAEEFYNRMVAWYDEDTDMKIGYFTISRTDEEVKAFEEELQAIAQEMNDTKHYYINTCHCNKWGRLCEYASICMNYDPNQTYMEFIKREEDYNGTEENRN